MVHARCRASFGGEVLETQPTDPRPLVELQPTTAATTSAAPRHLTTVATMSAWPFSSRIEVVQTGNGSLEAAPVAAYASCNARKHATCSQLPQLDPSAASIVLSSALCAPEANTIARTELSHHHGRTAPDSRKPSPSYVLDLTAADVAAAATLEFACNLEADDYCRALGTTAQPSAALTASWLAQYALQRPDSRTPSPSRARCGAAWPSCRPCARAAPRRCTSC